MDAGCMQTIRSGKGLRRRSDLRQPLLLRGTQSRSDRLASALVRDAPAAASPSQPASSKDTSVAKTYIRPKPPITCSYFLTILPSLCVHLLLCIASRFQAWPCFYHHHSCRDPLPHNIRTFPLGKSHIFCSLFMLVLVLVPDVTLAVMTTMRVVLAGARRSQVRGRQCCEPPCMDTICRSSLLDSRL